MKILIIFTILFGSMFLHGASFKNSNSMEIDYADGTIKVKAHEKKGNATYMRLNTYNDISFEYFSITSTLNFTYLDERYSRAYNKIYPVESYFELSELAINGYVTKDDVITAGILTFKEGAFSEMQKIKASQSDALMTLIYINMTGIFYTHHYDENKIQIGYAKRFGNDKILSKNRYEHSVDESDIMFMFTNNVYGKHTFKTNIMHSHILYESLSDKKNRPLGDLGLIGLGYSYNDLSESGYIGYGIIALSATHFDGSLLSPTGKKFEYPNVANFSDEGQRIGYSSLIGIKKEYDNILFKKDFYLGAEHFYASKYWISYVTDQSNFGYYTWGNLGNTYNIYTGVNINPTFKIGLNYQYQDIQYSKLGGGNSVKKVNDFTKGFYMNLNIRF